MSTASTCISSIAARKVFNIRGEETIEVDVTTKGGFGRASAPAGASRGKGEAIPYPKGGVDEAVKKVEKTVARKLVGADSRKQEQIDQLLHEIDGTDDFQNIGGNTSYATSLAVAEAAACTLDEPLFRRLAGRLADQLPHPLGNVLGGGKHARAKAPDIQEFLILPVKVNSFFEAAETNAMIHHKIGSLLEKEDPNFTGGRTDEGAWAPSLKSEDALEIVAEACRRVSEASGAKYRLGLDVAASSLWNPKKGCYIYNRDGIERDPGEQFDFVLELIKSHNLGYVEDPFHEEDFSGFAELTKKVGKHCLICGDDLFVTNTNLLARGIRLGSANATIIKGNQVGTVTDAWKATLLAQKANYIPVMSHRSGETTEAHIAHLAVAFGCPIIKAGVVEGARIAIINELVRIEETLGERAKIANLAL